MAGLAQMMGFGGGMPSQEEMAKLAQQMPGGIPGLTARTLPPGFPGASANAGEISRDAGSWRPPQFAAGLPRNGEKK